MKEFAIDVIGMIGFSSIVYGAYLQFGESIAFMLGGICLVLWALLKSKAK